MDAKLALQFDIAMSIGCAIPLGIWTDWHWLIQILISFIIFGNFYMAYKLRDMQNIGTSWIFFAVYFIILGGSTSLNLVASVASDCTNHKLLAAGQSIFVIHQLINVVMFCTVR